MPVLSEGDIVIAYFPQEDRSVIDLRPCLVLSVDENRFTAAKITTTELNRVWTYKLPQGRVVTSRGKIQKDSWVNLRRCEIISIQDTKQVVASLKPEVLKEIQDKLDTVL